MNLKYDYANEENYAKGRTKPIEYIVIHFTSNDGDTDEGNGAYFERTELGVSANYFTDEDSATCSVKDTDTAWHCGTKGTYKHPYCRNANSIGIEMCSKKDENGYYEIPENTIKNAVELTKIKMVEHGVPLDNVLRHFDVTGKNCPEPFVRNPQLWEDFKNRLTQGDEEQVEIKDVKFMNDTNGYGFTVKGVEIDGTNYVSARQLLETYGKTISWDEATETIIVKE